MKFKLATKNSDHMSYLPHMEVVNSDIMDMVLSQRSKFEYQNFTKEDVLKVLNKDKISFLDFQILLSPAAGEFLENLAQRSMELTRAHFGKNIYIFTPIYISNHCDNHCTYCGFNVYNKIRRSKLSDDEIEIEMSAIASKGIKEILILTGESEIKSNVAYIANACKIAKKHFDVVGVEIYPLNSDEYQILHENGADFVTIFQETYNHEIYSKMHLRGNKRIFPYRFNGQERALKGGMRGVAFGALLGIDDWRKDAFSTGFHAHLIQKKYPHAEISLSIPRLRPIINNREISPKDVGVRELVQVICAYRIFLPFANITISTRESAKVRDNAIKFGANKVSASVNVGIGGHALEQSGDEQFEISDTRDVEAMKEAIRQAGLVPVMCDYLYLK